MNKDEAKCRHCGHMRWWGTPGCIPIRSEYGDNLSREHEWMAPTIVPIHHYRTNAWVVTEQPTLSWFNKARKRLCAWLLFELSVIELAAIMRDTMQHSGSITFEIGDMRFSFYGCFSWRTCLASARRSMLAADAKALRHE